MYGLVNQGVRDLAVELGGDELWSAIKIAAGVEVDEFVGMDSYADEVTFRLVDATSVALGISPPDVLRAFGAHWIRYTARRGYGALFDMMGRTLPEFLANLDAMHARLSLGMPSLRPPSFVSTSMSDGRVRLEYWSERDGLAPMVLGLLEGLGEMYGVSVRVEHTVDRATGGDHDEFTLEYEPLPSLASSVESVTLSGHGPRSVIPNAAAVW